MKTYKYDAFISYRHTEPDKFVAENLHRKLEAFRLPKNILQKKTGRTRIERVFRDKDELPLTSNLEDPIRTALEESEYLIVICSPRLRESLWCQKEVQTFIGLHGREKVLAVLIEGEPKEAFPQELLYAEETIQESDGTIKTVKKEMEPLAADIRGKSRRRMKKAMKTEILRLLAPIFSVSFDDLKQRHRERKWKKILAAALAGMAVCLLFGAISTAMALHIRNQKVQIEAQNEALLNNQAVTLAEESLRQLAEGDRMGAVATAVSALTEYEGHALPYTPEAQYALTESLHAYDNGSYIKAQYQFEAAGIINFMKVSPERDRLLTCDEAGGIMIWDMATGECLAEINEGRNVLSDEADCIFLDNNRISYVNAQGGVSVYDIAARQANSVISADMAKGLYGDEQGKYLLVQDFYSLTLYDAQSFEELMTYRPDEDREIGYHFYFNEEGTVVAFQEYKKVEGDSILDAREGEIIFWNLEENRISATAPVGYSRIDKIRFRGDRAYLLLNESSEDFFGVTAGLMAVSVETGETFWQWEAEGTFGSYLFRPYADGARRLLVVTSAEAYLIDEEDGSEYGRFSLGESAAGGAVFTDSDMYILFTRSGVLTTLSVERMQTYASELQFQCHSRNVKEFAVSAEGYLVLPYQDNRVTLYNYSKGDIEESDWESVAVQETEEGLQYAEAAAWAEEKGLAKAALAERVFFNPDESMVFVCYTDKSMDIFSTAAMSLLGSLEGMKGYVNSYLGMDSQGNCYIRDYSFGYMLSPDYKLLAVIEGLKALDGETDRLILSHSNGSTYTVPVYTVEELLAKAQALVIR